MDAGDVRFVLWSRLDEPGLERCAFGMGTEHGGLEGVVITAFEGVPAEARYQVGADEAWSTTDVSVTLFVADEVGRIDLRASDGTWTVDDTARPDLDGCLDVDLGISPSTNTLPIRRLGLAVGEAAELDAAWVRFPELTVERLAQRYTHVAEGRWLYESTDSGFRADLLVDSDGLVIDYEGIWHRVADWSAPFQTEGRAHAVP